MKIALVSCSCRIRQQKWNRMYAKGSNSQWVQTCVKEACEKSTMALCSRRFLTFGERDTAVYAVDLKSRNKFRWDLLLQHAVRSLGLKTLTVSLCLDLVLVQAHYPSSSWKWIASCNNNLVWALKVYYPCIQLALVLISTKTVEERYKQNSKFCTYISSLLILSNLLIVFNFCPREAREANV